jgi:hypothetical protein
LQRRPHARSLLQAGLAWCDLHAAGQGGGGGGDRGPQRAGARPAAAPSRICAWNSTLVSQGRSRKYCLQLGLSAPTSAFISRMTSYSCALDSEANALFSCSSGSSSGSGRSRFDHGTGGAGGRWAPGHLCLW